MNVKNIKTVRDHIAAVDAKRFEMATWASAGSRGNYSRADVDSLELIHDCNTCGCIGGWSEGLLRVDESDTRQARELLGLSDLQAEELFFAHSHPLPMNKITQAEAVAVLDHLLATGEVDWSVAPSS